MKPELKFVDLFAGLSGFHHGLSKTGGFRCVFASEIEPYLQALYETNYGCRSHGDISQVSVETVPAHDVLCAGFPCQPFSLAGKKRGLDCPESGRLIEHVVRIAQHRKPEFLILENVPGLMTIADGSVWQHIRRAFHDLGYMLVHKVISPLDVAIPQNRKRLFVVGSLNHDVGQVFDWAESEEPLSVTEFLGDEPRLYKPVEPNKRKQLAKWQQLLSMCTLPDTMPVLSIAAPEFGATYPMDFSNMRLRDLRKYRGAYGRSLSDCSTWDATLASMPSYCRKRRMVPDWFKRSVEFSRDVHRGNEDLLAAWHADFDKRFNSWQVLEWRGDRENRNLSDHLLQFRASGIRVVKASTIPSLVAMTPTQIPIVGSAMRYLTKREAARFQDLHDLKELPQEDRFAFRAIGNAVNAKIIARLASNIHDIATKENFRGRG